jgi:hypothetical protein
LEAKLRQHIGEEVAKEYEEQEVSKAKDKKVKDENSKTSYSDWLEIQAEGGGK